MAKLQIITPEEALKLCRECAKAVYGSQPPSPEYAERVARLLFMTAAHESGGFHHNRQMNFNFLSTRGAHGLWQTEWVSVADSITYMQRNRLVARRCTDFVFGPGADLKWFDKVQRETVLQLICINARVSCMFARLHYIKIKAPVPKTHCAMADYAKRFYNTAMGKATPEQYLEAFEKYWPGVDV